MVPDTSSFADCQAIIAKYRLQDQLPPAVRQRLAAGAGGGLPETPKAADPCFDGTHNIIIGANCDALRAAALKAESLGYRPLILSSRMEGETRHVARVHGAIAREIAQIGITTG